MSSERFIESIARYPALSDKAMKELLYSEWLYDEESKAIFNVVKIYKSMLHDCVLNKMQLEDGLMMGQIVEGSSFANFIADIGFEWTSKDKTIDDSVKKYVKNVFIARNEEAIAERLAMLVVSKTKKYVDDDICYYLVKEVVERCYGFIADEKALYKKELDVYSLFSFLKKENEQNKEVSECLIRLGNAECSVKYIYKLRSLGYKVLLKSQYEGYLDKTKEMLCVESPNGNVFSISSHWTEEEAVKTILNFIDKI